MIGFSSSVNYSQWSREDSNYRRQQQNMQAGISISIFTHTPQQTESLWYGFVNQCMLFTLLSLVSDQPLTICRNYAIATSSNLSGWRFGNCHKSVGARNQSLISYINIKIGLLSFIVQTDIDTYQEIIRSKFFSNKEFTIFTLWATDHMGVREAIPCVYTLCRICRDWDLQDWLPRSIIK